MKPKYGEVRSHRTSSPSLTIPVKTRTPLEAFQMLRQGQPIDIMAGYYNEDIKDDFWMMDKTAKLHALAELKAGNIQREKDILFQQQEIEIANQIIQKNAEESQQNSQASQGNNSEQTQGSTKPPGTVS